jgi:RNA polymerase sigma factor (sigma-70 family)
MRCRIARARTEGAQMERLRPINRLMDGDRSFPRNVPGANSRDSGGSTRLNHIRAEGVFLSAGGDPRIPGVPFPRKPTPAREKRAVSSSATPDRADVQPQELQNLLNADSPARFEAAWDVFVARHHRLLLHVARKVMPASESAMDGYAQVLERLRRDNCRVLRGYSPDGRSQFTTWLVVVTRRTCVDFYRQKYGRPRGAAPSQAALIERDARHRLATFAGVDDALAHIPDEQGGPESALRNGQLHDAVTRAVGSLSADDQLLLQLRFSDDLPAAKIAVVMSLPSQFHVYRRLKVVCAELRRQLIERGVEDSAP